MRNIIDFNDGWLFEGRDRVRLPHNAVDLPFNYFDEKVYQRPFTYEKTFTFDPAWTGREVTVHFEGAMANAEVRLDGQLIARHADGYTPFTARLSDCTPGEHVLTVTIDGSENPAIPPFGNVIDYLTYAGIYREVRLEVAPALHIRNVKIETPNVLCAPRASARVWLANLNSRVNLAIRWFAGFGLNDRLPDHSSLTRVRQRWGAERFRCIFERTVKACVAAGIAKGEIVHVDASLIRADVAWESLAVRHVGAVAVANGDQTPGPEEDQALRDSKKTGKFKKVCLTDPDASMATSGRNRRLEPSYKQHSVVDDELGVVLDVEVTTGEVNEGEQMLARLDAAATMTGAPKR